MFKAMMQLRNHCRSVSNVILLGLLFSSYAMASPDVGVGNWIWNAATGTFGKSLAIVCLIAGIAGASRSDGHHTFKYIMAIIVGGGILAAPYLLIFGQGLLQS